MFEKLSQLSRAYSGLHPILKRLIKITIKIGIIIFVGIGVMWFLAKL